MKSQLSVWTMAVLFAGSLGVAGTQATSTSHAAYSKPIEVTGCLEQGPVAKEYLLKTSDGKTWGINETDILINHYVGQTVTIAGDAMLPTADERKSGGAKHYLKARDLTVESESCHQ